MHVYIHWTYTTNRVKKRVVWSEGWNTSTQQQRDAPLRIGMNASLNDHGAHAAFGHTFARRRRCRHHCESAEHVKQQQQARACSGNLPRLLWSSTILPCASNMICTADRCALLLWLVASGFGAVSKRRTNMAVTFTILKSGTIVIIIVIIISKWTLPVLVDTVVRLPTVSTQVIVNRHRTTTIFFFYWICFFFFFFLQPVGSNAVVDCKSKDWASSTVGRAGARDNCKTEFWGVWLSLTFRIFAVLSLLESFVFVVDDVDDVLVLSFTSLVLRFLEVCFFLN